MARSTDELRDVPVQNLIPRGYGPNPPAPRGFETGGTTGAPKRVIMMPDWLEASIDRMPAGRQFAGRLPPTSSSRRRQDRKIGCMYDYVVARHLDQIEHVLASQDVGLMITTHRCPAPAPDGRDWPN